MAVKYTGVSMNAGSNEVAVEGITICPRGLQADVAMRTEYAFTLPRGFVDAAGTVHREGAMRLATARDEIEPLRDAQARQNEAYLAVLLLARVVTRIGDGRRRSRPSVVEGLYAADFDHLQRLYERINTDGEAVGAVTCPHCAAAVRGRPHGDRGRAPGGMTRPSAAEVFAETARSSTVTASNWPKKSRSQRAKSSCAANCAVISATLCPAICH